MNTKSSEKKQTREPLTFYEPPDIQDKIDKMVNNPNPPQIAPIKYFLVFASIAVNALARGVGAIHQAGLPMAAAEKMHSKSELEESPLITATVEQPGQVDFFKTSPKSKFKGCDDTGSAEKCARTVCAMVAATITPLNKNRPGESSLNSEDMEKMKKMGSAGMSKYELEHAKLLERANRCGIRKDSEVFQDLNRRLFVTAHMDVPNCAGMASRVVTILSHQPAIQKENARLMVHAARYMNRETAHHSIARITIPGNRKSSDKKFICDPFDLPAGPKRTGKATFCDSQEVEAGIGGCIYYQDRFWSAPEKNTFEISSNPKFKGLSDKQQKFYEDERAKLESEYNQKLAKNERSRSLA
ncbi:MAG TPA: hypothetical protein VHE99_02715 [Gammaproteobacteria bacterium]|nr:hypothetical protein [Gammaproteobacteria bacterium]